jgi:hypothetical protein
MRRGGRSLEDVQKLIAGTMGADAYARVRAAYSEHAMSSTASARQSSAQRHLSEIRTVADLVQKRAVAVAVAQCGRRQACAVRDLARVVERLHQGDFACEADALRDLDACCASVQAMERRCAELAAAAAADAYSVGKLAGTGQTVLVACQLLRVTPKPMGGVGDEYLHEKLAVAHKHLLHEVLVGALVVHGSRLATAEARLRGAAPEHGAVYFAHCADRARAHVRAFFLYRARTQGAAERMREMARAGEALRAEGQGD